MVESGTVAEVRQYTGVVQTGNSPAEVQEHGISGKEITDSIKELIKGWLTKYVEDDSKVRRRLKKLLHVDVTKEGIEQAFRVINEVLGMVFHGPA
jgi:predicted RNase H-like HicB family nuclease